MRFAVGVVFDPAIHVIAIPKGRVSIASGDARGRIPVLDLRRQIFIRDPTPIGLAFIGPRNVVVDHTIPGIVNAKLVATVPLDLFPARYA